MSTRNKTDRRSFLKTSVGASAAAAVAFPAPYVIAETAKGANERIGVGFIGVGGRSGAHQGIVQNFQKQGVTQPVAVCDIYRPHLEAASKRLVYIDSPTQEASPLRVNQLRTHQLVAIDYDADGRDESPRCANLSNA